MPLQAPVRLVSCVLRTGAAACRAIGAACQQPLAAHIGMQAMLILAMLQAYVSYNNTSLIGMHHFAYGSSMILIREAPGSASWQPRCFHTPCGTGCIDVARSRGRPHRFPSVLNDSPDCQVTRRSSLHIELQTVHQCIKCHNPAHETQQIQPCRPPRLLLAPRPCR